MKHTESLSKDNLIVESVIFRLEPDFAFRLMSRYRELTETELKLCILFKNGFSESETGLYLNLGTDALRKTIKNVIRKMNLKDNIKLKNHLNKLSRSIK